MIERRGEHVWVHSTDALSGVVRPPGSKSITNRALLCAALADGTSTLHDPSVADDSMLMCAGLQTLGLRVAQRPQTRTIEVQGCAGQLPNSDAELDCGDAGTALRFLTALCALGYGRYRVDGSARMRERPIRGLVDALHELGVAIGYDAHEGYPPLTLVARGLPGGRAVISKPISSQYVSALLMVAPYATRDVLLEINGGLLSRPYVAMTCNVMRLFGVEALEADSADRFIVPAPQRYRADAIAVEPDASAATYFWAAAALTGGAITVAGLHRDSLQGDAAFVDVLAEMGCTVADTPEGLCVRGPERGALRGITIDLNAMPDTVQTLAVVALAARGVTEIRNVANLRVKETDRLAALEAELSKLGARVELRDDGIRIDPPKKLHEAEIATHNDHRMAMSFALAGLVGPGVLIRDAGCASKSCPEYFELLAGLQA